MPIGMGSKTALLRGTSVLCQGRPSIVFRREGGIMRKKYKYRFNFCRILGSHSGHYEELCLLGYNAV
jgi:hypothetical protein